MPRVRLEPTAPVFGRAKTVHVFDRAATVTGPRLSHLDLIILILFDEELNNSEVTDYVIFSSLPLLLPLF
jgi:hypothetical protein